MSEYRDIACPCGCETRPVPLKERKIFSVQKDDRFGWHNVAFATSSGAVVFGTFKEARQALLLALQLYPHWRWRIHFTIPADIGETKPKPTPAVRLGPSAMARRWAVSFRCEGDLQGGNPCLNQYYSFCNPGL